jgi:hypothetical protein
MPIEAILCNIQFGIDKPLYSWFFKIPFEYFIPFFSPGKIGCNISPKILGIIYAFPVRQFVLIERGNLERV